VVPNRGAADTFQECRKNLDIISFPFLLQLKCGFNLLCSLHIIHFTAIMYLNQFRALKCFLEKIAMVGNMVGVPQNMEYVFRVLSVKKVENH
jgi:hypothetical protein